MEHSKCQVVEVNKRSPDSAGCIDLQCFCSNPVIPVRILISVDNKVISLSSMQDDVIEVTYWLDEESISCYECELMTVNGEPGEEVYMTIILYMGIS